MEFTDQNFEQEVEKNTGLVLVDFFATWCGPCKLMGPIINELSEEYKNKVKIGKLDVDVGQKYAEKYSIMGVPTLILFRNGKIVEQITGLQNKDNIIEMISKHL